MSTNAAGHREEQFKDPPPAYRGHDLRRSSKGEPRWPPALALVVAIVLYAFLPGKLQLGPRLLVPIVEGVLAIVVIATNPVRITRETRFTRIASLVLTGLIVLTNLTSLGLLISQLVTAQAGEAGPLLLAALQIWATNVIAFALLLWDLDRGGPVRRTTTPHRGQMPLADLRFSQDENRDTVEEVAAGSSVQADWMPTFVDYFYVSLTNSSAFSPTDTMPLTSRAKLLMGLEATAALITSLLVIARAVGALN